MSIQNYTIFIFGLVYLVFIYSIRTNETFDSFSLGGRKVKSFPIFASLSATIIGPGFSMGLVGQGADTGVLYWLLGVMYGLQMIATGLWVAPRVKQKFKTAYSIGDVVGGKESHDSTPLKALSGFFSVVVGIGVVGVLAKAGGGIFSSVVNISPYLGSCLVIAAILIYSFRGGIKATIQTDVFQFLMFVILIPLLAVRMTDLWNIELSAFMATAKNLTQSAIDSESITSLLALLVWFALGDVLQPPMLNRILASENSSVSRLAFVSSGLFCILWLLLMTSIGVLSHFAQGVSMSGDGLLMELGQLAFPSYIYGIFIVAMLGVVMSSLDSIINAGATTLVNDCIKPLVRHSKQRSIPYMFYSRVATIVIGFVGLLLSFFLPSILSGLLSIASIWAPTMVVVLMASIHLDKQYWEAGAASMVVGFISSLAFLVCDRKLFLPPIVCGIFISLISYIFVHNLLKVRKS
jgi:SSS family solute:Na+ symporter